MSCNLLRVIKMGKMKNTGYFCCFSVQEVIHRHFSSRNTSEFFVSTSNVWWVTWGFLDVWVITDDMGPSLSVIQQISMPLCSRPVWGPGSSVLNVGKVLSLKSTGPFEDVLLIVWVFSSWIKFLLTAYCPWTQKSLLYSQFCILHQSII